MPTQARILELRPRQAVRRFMLLLPVASHHCSPHPEHSVWFTKYLALLRTENARMDRPGSAMHQRRSIKAVRCP